MIIKNIIKMSDTEQNIIWTNLNGMENNPTFEMRRQCRKNIVKLLRTFGYKLEKNDK